MALTQELLAIGLSDKEADVYLAALQLGYSSVQEISQKANINRTTVYTHIKNLISRGLLSATEKNGKIFYVAERPEKLQYIYEQQENEIKRRRQMLDQIMPKLESIYNVAKDKPSVRYYSYNSPEDLKVVRQEIVQRRSNVMYNIFNYELYKEYVSRRHVQSILDSVQTFKTIYIANHKIVDSRLRPLLKNEKFFIKFLTEAKFGFLCEVLISDDNVYIAGKGDWLIIRDELFSQTLGLLFEALWGIAEEF